MNLEVMKRQKAEDDIIEEQKLHERVKVMAREWIEEYFTHLQFIAKHDNSRLKIELKSFDFKFEQ